jgi:carboxybiotin decarboxylase
VLGCVAFALSTAGGLLLGKLMSRLPGSPVNPLIGAAGVSAVPMAARVAHNVAQERTRTTTCSCTPWVRTWPA